MKETLIDIETYCEADIKKCGLYRYVSDPSFEILLIAWATDEGEGFGETKLADLASGDPFPKELLDDFKDSDVTLIAHNAAFERVSFSRYLQQHYPGRYLKPGTFAYASTFEAQEDEGEVTAEQKSVVFTVRWCSEVNKLTSTGFRVLFRGELYDITSVDPMNYGKKTIKLHCRLERRQK